MEHIAAPSLDPMIGINAHRRAPVIIATDGRQQSDAALGLGRLLAGERDARRVVSVLRPMSTIPDAQIAITDEINAARRSEARTAVQNQIVRMWDEDGDMELLEGDPATLVANIAKASGARLIVCGLGRHRITDRVFGDETALRLARVAEVPVLAVDPRNAQAPSRIVVAIDFSETSLRAAHLAMEIAASDSTVYLAHVAPRGGNTTEWKEWRAAYKANALRELQRVREALRAPPEIRTELVELLGDPATELLAFASSVNADLIATGSHGRGFVARLLVGSVATRIVRCSSCSVLTVPHAAVESRAVVGTGHRRVLPTNEWTARLNDFSRANRGRTVVLDIDEPEVDPQPAQIDQPLLGASFDPNDGRVTLMFGDDSSAGPHSSHSITGVTSIVVIRDDLDVDLGLRIANGIGLTTLTFTS